MKTRRALFVISIMLVFVLACQTLLVGGSGTEVPVATTEANVPPQESQSASSPLAGLTYQIFTRDSPTTNQEYWQFGEDGNAYKVFGEPKVLYGPDFSPDGRKLVYTGYGPEFCTWLVDYDVKQVSPVSCQGVEHVHIVVGWLPGKPDTLLSLKGYDVSVGSYMGSPEILSLVDGSSQPLDSTLIYDLAASPDGNWIAYETTVYPNEGFLYSQGSGVKAFDPREYGVDYPYAGNPVWSPDGTKIAWGLMDDSVNSAIGVFDVEAKSGRELHPFKDGNFNPDMMPGPTPASVQWSPNGKWLALDVCYLNGSGQNWCDPEKSGLWIMSEDGAAESRIEGSFAGWSPDSQWVLSKITKYDANESELRVSHLDGSGLFSLGKIANAYHNFLPAWSPEGKYLAYNDGEHVLVMEAGVWEANQLGAASDYKGIVWNPDGSRLAFVDGNFAVWLAEAGAWNPQQVSQIESTDGVISFFWHSSLLPAFDTLTKLPPGTPAPFAANPTPVPAEPDCSTGVVITEKDTPKGQYLEVCANGNTSEIGPLAKGVFAVGPNNKFFVYCANNGLVYAVRVGDTRLQPIGDVRKDFSAIIRNDEPLFEIKFSGNGPYKVTIFELRYKQNKELTIPNSITAP